MSNVESPVRDGSARPLVVFLGMPCAFSAPPLAALVGAGFDVAAVVLPGPPGGQPVRWHHPRRRVRPGIALAAASGPLGRPSLLGVADSAGIPLLFVASIRSEAAGTEIARLRPDAVAVACFPERLPAALLRLPPLGALNVHPSLLPLDRGPSPLFWVFHRGADATGVSVHLMEETLDTGPVVRQRAIPIPEGSRLADLELEAATLGGELLVEAILARAAGDLSPAPQDASRATSASLPTPSDVVVDPATWSARRAYRFVCGVQSAVVRLPNGDLVPVVDAERRGLPMRAGTAAIAEGNGLLVGFADGFVVFRRGHSDRTA